MNGKILIDVIIITIPKINKNSNKSLSQVFELEKKKYFRDGDCR